MEVVYLKDAVAILYGVSLCSDWELSEKDEGRIDRDVGDELKQECTNINIICNVWYPAFGYRNTVIVDD